MFRHSPGLLYGIRVPEDSEKEKDKVKINTPMRLLYGIRPVDQLKNVQNDLKKEIEIHKSKTTLNERLEKLEKMVEGLVDSVNRLKDIVNHRGF